MADYFINIPNSGSPSWKKPVPTGADLPLYGNSDGDVRVTLDDESIYIWDATTLSWKLAATPAGAVAIDALLGDVSATGPGAVPATVNFVGGVSAADVASGANAANAATSSNTPNTIVKRDGSGNFSAGTITANLTGNVSGTSTNVTGIVLPINGGTGIANNNASTITISGSFGLTATLTNTTSITFPTSGTLATLAGIETFINKSIDAGSNTLTNITNASISPTAAIAYSKLNLSNSIVNTDINASAAIAYSKLNLTNSIVNADINASAAIARSKIAAGSINQVVVNDGSGNLSSVAVLPVANGGTGSSAQNFVDLTTNQTVAGDKTFSGHLAVSNTTSTALAVNTTTFVVDAANGAVGVNTLPAATAVVDIVNNSGSTKAIQVTGYGSNVGFRGRQANGSLASPSATLNTNTITFFSGRGYGSTGFAAASTGVVNIVATENFTDTSMATAVAISTTPTGAITSTERMRINSTGNVLIGTTTDNGNNKLQVNGSFTAGTFALTDAANIATNASLANRFTVTLGGNRNLSAPTNPTDGQKVVWVFTQDGTGGRTLTYDAIFDFGNMPTLILSSAAAKRDYMGAIYNLATTKWDVVAYSTAF